MEELKDYSKDLYDLTEKELANRFGSKYPGLLRRGLNPEYFPILTDDTLSVDEMAEKLELSKDYVYGLRSALLKEGFAERRTPNWFYKVGRRKYAEKKRKIIPLEEILRRREERLRRKEERKSLRDEKFLSYFENPLTTQDASYVSGISINNVSKKANRLVREGLLNKLSLNKSKKGRRYSIRDLVGQHHNIYFYKDDSEVQMAEIVLQRILDASDYEIHPYKKSALTRHIKKVLPKNISEMVRDCYISDFYVSL